MMRRRTVPSVFFPWERRKGFLGAIARTRVRLILVLGLAAAFVWVVHEREEQAAAVRATRASLGNTSRAILEYRADHAGACPKALGELVTGGYARDVPIDAWGRPLKLVCPGRKDPAGFDLSSDGPGGEPGGLDRVE